MKKLTVKQIKVKTYLMIKNKYTRPNYHVYPLQATGIWIAEQVLMSQVTAIFSLTYAVDQNHRLPLQMDAFSL